MDTNIQTIAYSIATISLPAALYFLKGILDEFKELRKLVASIDNRVVVLETLNKK
jgi:hypothetical protein